jgi:diguanylate cyclase (GGDEF)-like protein/PAS domain S-box-containing protein
VNTGIPSIGQALPGASPAALLVSLRRRVACRVHAAIVVAAAALIFAVWTLTWERVQFDRSETFESAVKRNSNMVLAQEENTMRTLKGVHQVLADIALEYRDEGTRLDIQALVAEGVADPSVFHFLGVVDERGALVLGSRPFSPLSMSDREYFTVHKRAAGREIFVGKPAINRITGEWSIPVSRRISRADGSFAGVAFMAVRPEFFTDFYSRADLGQNGLVTLVGLDGIARTRRTGQVGSLGQDMHGSTLLAEQAKKPAGSFISTGKIDGVQRLFAYRTLESYPLIVSVGTSLEETLAGFRERERAYTLNAAAASAFITLFALGIAYALRRQTRATAELQRMNARFAATFSQAAVGIALNSLDGHFLRVNDRYCAMLGYEEKELLARTFFEILHPDDLAGARESFPRLLAESSLPPLENRHIRKDGTTLWTQVSVALVRTAAGAPDYLVAMVEDISERKQAQRELEMANTVLATEQEASLDAVLLVDDRGRIRSCNQRFAKLWNIPGDLIAAGDDEPVLHAVVAQVENPEVFLARVKYLFEHRDEKSSEEVRTRDGRTIDRYSAPVVGKGGEYFGRVWYFRDVTESKRMQERLTRQAHFDALTGLPNRVLCFDRLKQALSHAHRMHRGVGLLFVDLDRFKNVNDTLGHPAGDRLLQEVAARLTRCVRADDTVSRLGGDEFAVILTEIGQAQDAAVVAKKILDAMGRPFNLGGTEVFVGASIGIATYPADGEDGETLVKNADAAMFRAKLLGRNNFQFYTAALNERAVEKLKLENSLRHALERGEFLLHFQPKADLATGAITGFEALLRWKCAERGLIQPGHFVPVLEESGLIVPVGEWVLRAACGQLRAWRDAGFAPLPIAVNLSPRQFHRQDICGTIRRALAEHGVDASLLELEITESAAMDNAEEAVVKLNELRALGVHLSMDDFGTGYSSLSYLKRFPLDSVKIDRSFVTDLPDDADDAAISKAVIGMAHSLSMKVIAEGVENERQRAFLAGSGCDQMQGYLLSRPLPAAECVRFLERRREQTLRAARVAEPLRTLAA